MEGQTFQPNQSKDPLRNMLFDKYEMGKVLGQGTFAKVYHGRNLITNESVAIKVINKDKVQKQGLMEQIRREISVMSLVKHPHIVELKEVMATKGKVYVVIEYVKGGELFAKLAKGKLDEATARKYFQQLVCAIDFCHSRGVSHRDIKPENLLLDENGDLKVSDFGLSALPEQLRNDGMLHTPCGTPAYVAPEVLRKKGYDGSKADIWSCGVILFVLLSGYLPFRDENVIKMYRKVFKAAFEIPPWISSDARGLISKLLVVDPRKRYSIPEILQNPWFQNGSRTFIAFPIHKLPNIDFDDNKKVKVAEKKASPPFYNAFDLISSFSSGFDLSSMFESKRKSRLMFTSRCSASSALEKLDLVGKKLNLTMTSWKEEFKVIMQGKTEGRKGKVALMAEVFEIVPEVAVVELSKSAGDTLEYKKFCEEDMRPALKDIVWSWNGEN